MPKLTPEERKLRTKELAQKRRLNNIEKCREYSREYYEKNKEEILKGKKAYRQLTKEKHYAWRKDYRLKLTERTKLLGRIHYWRREQAKLAEEELEISSYKPYNGSLDYSFSTLGISEQLGRKNPLFLVIVAAYRQADFGFFKFLAQVSRVVHPLEPVQLLFVRILEHCNVQVLSPSAPELF